MKDQFDQKFLEGYQIALSASENEIFLQGILLGRKESDEFWKQAITEVYGEEFLNSLLPKIKTSREHSSRNP